MITIDTARDRKFLQAEFNKADELVVDVLSGDTRRFLSCAHMRESLNRARSLREWAGHQLWELERAMDPERADIR